MSNETKELIKSFEEWIFFIHSVRELSEEIWDSSIESGKWTVRDIVSHIMLWDKYFYEEAIVNIATDKLLTLKHLNYDDFNRKAMDYGRTLKTNELIEMTIFCREKIIEDINRLSDEVIDQNYLVGDNNLFNISQYLKDFIWHDQHHMKPLKEYLKTIKT